jgi:hypothetical protein
MLALLSPAKSLNFEDKNFIEPISEPTFSDEIKELVNNLKSKSEKGIKNLMKLSDNLAELNYNRYQNFTEEFNKDNSQQSIFAFTGDVYEGFDARNLSESEIKLSNSKIAILSGLYGLLKPLDLMQPYRLEMGTKMKNDKGEDLYDFWGEKITDQINELESELVINLASNEYFKSVKKKKLKAKLVNIDFKEDKGGKVSIIGIYAKKARGYMARFIVKNDVNNLKKIKDFDVEGYKFIESMSDDANLTFLRKH